MPYMPNKINPASARSAATAGARMTRTSAASPTVNVRPALHHGVSSQNVAPSISTRTPYTSSSRSPHRGRPCRPGTSAGSRNSIRLTPESGSIRRQVSHSPLARNAKVCTRSSCAYPGPGAPAGDAVASYPRRSAGELSHDREAIQTQKHQRQRDDLRRDVAGRERPQGKRDCWQEQRHEAGIAPGEVDAQKDHRQQERLQPERANLVWQRHRAQLRSPDSSGEDQHEPGQVTSPQGESGDPGKGP